ncbi:MAG: hypothetical protein PHY47_04315 [Lachnospiraceae bacterium]|nr:hypothetical protein [Lachnospiraceae bacterium]
MMKLLKQLYRVRKLEILLLLGVELFGFAFGYTLLNLTIAWDKTVSSYLLIGTTVSIIFGLFMTAFLGICSNMYHYNMAVSMGRTRSSFIVANLLLNILECVIVFAVGGLIQIVEKRLGSLRFPNLLLEMDFSIILQAKYIVAIILLIVTVELFVAALILRYGNKAFWALWALWMFICIGPTHMSDVIKTKNSVTVRFTADFLNHLIHMNLLQKFGILLFIVAVLGTISIQLLKKQQV